MNPRAPKTALEKKVFRIFDLLIPPDSSRIVAKFRGHVIIEELMSLTTGINPSDPIEVTELPESGFRLEIP